MTFKKVITDDGDSTTTCYLKLNKKRAYASLIVDL